MRSYYHIEILGLFAGVDNTPQMMAEVVYVHNDREIFRRTKGQHSMQNILAELATLTGINHHCQDCPYSGGNRK